MRAWVREEDAVAVGEQAAEEAAARVLEADLALAEAEEVKDHEDLHSHNGRGRHG